MIYILTIIMFLMGLCLCVIKDKPFSNCKFKPLKSLLTFFSCDKYNGYFIDIIVTILGVTCAILLTNYDTEKRESKQTIDLLKYLSHEIEEKDKKINAVISGEIEGFEDGLTDDTIEYVRQFAPMVSIETLLTVSPYQYTISGICYNALYECRLNINILLSDMENSEENIEKSLTEMSYELKYMKGVAEFEIKYQNGKIDYDELGNRVNEWYVDCFDSGNFISDCYGNCYMEAAPVE